MHGKGGMGEMQQHHAAAGGAQESQHDQLAALARSLGLHNQLGGLQFGAAKQEELSQQVFMQTNAFAQVLLLSQSY